MVLDGNSLYVADTSNQLIRRVDFGAKIVETVAGTGEQVYEFSVGGAAQNIPLNSPWDLQFIAKQLFVAMSGDHQIWRLDLTTNTIAPSVSSSQNG